MSVEAVAARYAQALYELGIEQNNLPTVTDEVRRQYIGHMTEMICGGLLKPPSSRM